MEDERTPEQIKRIKAELPHREHTEAYAEALAQAAAREHSVRWSAIPQDVQLAYLRWSIEPLEDYIEDSQAQSVRLVGSTIREAWWALSIAGNPITVEAWAREYGFAHALADNPTTCRLRRVSGNEAALLEQIDAAEASDG